MSTCGKLGKAVLRAIFATSYEPKIVSKLKKNFKPKEENIADLEQVESE